MKSGSLIGTPSRAGTLVASVADCVEPRRRLRGADGVAIEGKADMPYCTAYVCF
jgi:hypothetical protein